MAGGEKLAGNAEKGVCVVFTDDACPYAERVCIALDELGGPSFRRELIDMYDKPESYVQLYRSVHPDPAATVRVPLFVDVDGTKLIESVVIVEFLAAKYGAPGRGLLPSNPLELAKVRLFLEVLTGQFIPLFYKLLRGRGDGKAGKEDMAAVLKVLDAYLLTHGRADGGAYFLGSQYSLAEVVATPHLKRMLVALPAMRGVDPAAMAREEGLPRLAAWMQACVSRASARAQVAPDARLLQAAEAISKE